LIVSVSIIRRLLASYDECCPEHFGYSKYVSSSQNGPLEKHHSNRATQFKKNHYAPATISLITLMEVLGAVEDKKRPHTRQLLEKSFSILNLDNSIIEAYCKIYRKLKEEANLLSYADLIAATAMAHDLFLETKNLHFVMLKPWFKAKIRIKKKLEHFVVEACVFSGVACGTCLLYNIEQCVVVAVG
jgi:predicted nucleic acid-binding protein